MAKKIQVSTVRKLADVQVIALNTPFVARAIRAKCELERLQEINRFVAADEIDGRAVTRWQILDAEEFAKIVISFIDDLCDALENGVEEKEDKE